MSRNIATRNVGFVGYFVNAAAVTLSVALIAAGYFAALGQFAGVA
ncbi:MAG: hypothetical protein ACE5FO_06040 [Parvularculaceae bacterium]